MITHELDGDDKPRETTFILWVPQERRVEAWDGYPCKEKMLKKIQTMPEMKWLTKTKTE